MAIVGQYSFQQYFFGSLVDKYLKPPFAKPPFRLSGALFESRKKS